MQHFHKLLLTAFFSIIIGLSFAQPANKIEIYLLNRNVPQLDEKLTNGQFYVSFKDLNQDPLITDDEITGYDANLHQLFFTEEGARKLAALNPGNNRGIQFALTVDRKPIVTGYIVNNRSGAGSATYTLRNIGDTAQLLLKGMPEFGTNVRIKEQRDNILFLNALKATNRLRH